MLRNPLDPDEVRNRQQFPKNNFFCYRWRILDHFNKSIDRQMFQMSVQGADNHKSLMSQKFLDLHKSRYHGSRSDLVVELAKDAMKFLDRRRQEQQRTSKAEVMLSNATRSLMDRAFNTLLAFSTELNTLLGLSELFITATEPEVKKRINSSETSIAIFIQSHLSTSLYRLIAEGRQDRIAFYITDSDNLLGIDEVSLLFEPTVEWKAHFDPNGEIYWVSANGILTDEMIDVACAELLRRLLETTQERLAPKTKYETNKSTYDFTGRDPWENCKVEKLSVDNDFSDPFCDFQHKSDYSDSLLGSTDPEPAPSFHPIPYNATGTGSDSRFGPVPEPAPSFHPIPYDVTRTDSVPSLVTLIRESGKFSTQSEHLLDTISGASEEKKTRAKKSSTTTKRSTKKTPSKKSTKKKEK